MHLGSTYARQPSISSSTSGRFHVANQFDQILDSWRLVYDVYVRTNLIHPNPYLIHATTQSIGPHTAVFCGTNDNGIQSTLTAIVDDDEAAPELPLDLVYKKELDALRRQGRRLIEYGMFAHRGQILWESSWGSIPGTFDRDQPKKSRCIKESLYELMRLAFYFGLTRNSTDFVIGVHPRHAAFYRRAFGFIQVGHEARPYSTVKNQPVVLLHGSLEKSLKMTRTPYVLDYCLHHPVQLDAFGNRFRFNRNPAANPHLINGYLSYKRLTQPHASTRPNRKRNSAA